MHSKSLFIISVICCELQLKTSFRTMLYTLISFADNNNNEINIPINTIINVLNRRNLSDSSNRRRISAELDRYISIQIERNVQLFSYETFEVNLIVSFPILDLASEILNLANLDLDFATMPNTIIERVARQIIRERMNPIIELPKPKPTAEELISQLNTTTNRVLEHFNEMITNGEVDAISIRDEMVHFLNTTTAKVMELPCSTSNLNLNLPTEDIENEDMIDAEYFNNKHISNNKFNNISNISDAQLKSFSAKKASKQMNGDYNLEPNFYRVPQSVN